MGFVVKAGLSVGVRLQSVDRSEESVLSENETRDFDFFVLLEFSAR